MYTGKSKAWVDILRIASAERVKYDQVLKAAEERAERRLQQTGTRPDPKNSSNVKEQHSVVRTVEQCLAAVLQEERSNRYEEVGYTPVNWYGEQWTELIEAGREYFSGRTPRGATREEMAVIRAEREARLETAVEAVVVDQKSEEYLVEQHRARVLSGDEEATAADAEWLVAKAREAAEGAATMKADADRLAAVAAAAQPARRTRASQPR